MSGRPPKPENERKTSVLRIMMTKSDLDLLEAAAKSEREDTSTWARTVLLGEAEKIIPKKGKKKPE